MGRLIDLTGQTFGRLTVIEKAPTFPGSHSACWLCKCECGNTKIVRSNDLKAGGTQSCGCLYKETRPKSIDITGKRSGMLVALYPTDKRVDRHTVWHCRCDCGNECDIPENALNGRSRTSCGCRKRSAGELEIQKILLDNHIDFIYDTPYFTDLITDSGTPCRFDFILLKNNQPYRLIEYDGQQHYYEGLYKDLNRTQYRDQLKNQYAKEHNLPLVRIPFQCLGHITLEMLLGDEFLVI